MKLPDGAICALVLGSLWIGCHSIVEYPAGNGAGVWTNDTANLAGLQSECGNMSLLSARPDRDALIAGIALHGLWVSANGASGWSPLGQGNGSAVITNRPSSIVYDPDHPATFWETGLYNGGGVYRTDDDGATFAQLGTATHNELLSVDFTDPARRTLLAGGHESAHLLRSTDGGGTWTDLGARLPATAGSTSYPLVLDGKTHLLGTALSSGAAVFRTTDGGDSWVQVSATPVHSRPLVASGGAIFWLLDDGGVITSVDQGTTWTRIAAAGTLTSTTAGLIELPDGRFAAVGIGHLSLSSDRGATWQPKGPAMPYTPVGLVYSRYRKAFYIWHFDCTGTTPDPIPADAIVSLAFDYLAP